MKKQVQIGGTNRREMLKLSGAGVLGTVAAGTLAPTAAQAAAIKIAHAMWTHGHSMQIEYPERIAAMRRAGFSINVEPKSSTINWFHFAIPTPVIVDDVRLRANQVMLRFKTYSVDAWVRDVHVYDGERLIAAHNNVNLSKDHLFEIFVVPDTPLVQWGIGISIGVACGVEMMDHHMEFFAAGCDFTAVAPPKP
ncbi:MAG: hypothetical protein MUC88_12950 [Planctomycetes bacterium]|jgi:hypothetical protein|nr:hypothetical protein [Planctomycetota bacterium]